MDSARQSLLVVLLCALAVVSCATWIERRAQVEEPPARESPPAPMRTPAPHGPATAPAREPASARDSAPAAAPAPARKPASRAKAAAPRPAPEAEVPSLLVPVLGIAPAQVRDNFAEPRGKRRHNAIDIMARRGTPVLAANDGPVARVYRHPLGGLSVYQYDASGRFVYYYGHLDGYAKGIEPGVHLARGAPVGFVGSTGNAPASAPHLHFAMYRLEPGQKWHRGVPMNPHPHFEDWVPRGGD